MKPPDEDDGLSVTNDPNSIVIKSGDGTETVIVSGKKEAANEDSQNQTGNSYKAKRISFVV